MNNNNDQQHQQVLLAGKMQQYLVESNTWDLTGGAKQGVAWFCGIVARSLQTAA